MLGLACHVGDWDAIPGFVDGVLERFGRIDVLVNNAGINPARIGAGRHDARLLAQGVLGQPRGAAAHEPVRAPIMREQGGGSIVNIATMAAYSGGAEHLRVRRVEGCALNLTKSMAQEWAQWNVRVNMLSPGPFMSEMMEGGAATHPGFKRADRRRHAHEADRRARTRSSGRSATS